MFIRYDISQTQIDLNGEIDFFKPTSTPVCTGDLLTITNPPEVSAFIVKR